MANMEKTHLFKAFASFRFFRGRKGLRRTWHCDSGADFENFSVALLAGSGSDKDEWIFKKDALLPAQKVLHRYSLASQFRGHVCHGTNRDGKHFSNLPKLCWVGVVMWFSYNQTSTRGKYW